MMKHYQPYDMVTVIKVTLESHIIIKQVYGYAFQDNESAYCQICVEESLE